jgi:type VI secretion system protein
MNETTFDILTQSPGSHVEQVGRTPRESSYQSVKSHLQRLLSCRQGSLVHLPDYGLPDIAALYLGLPYTRDHIMACLRHCIATYEPRIRHPHIRSLDMGENHDGAAFEVSGEISQQFRIRYVVTLFRDGCIRVSTSGEFFHG